MRLRLWARRKGGRERAADDHSHDLVVADRVDLDRADVPAVPEHGEPIAEPPDLEEAMGDEDDRDVLVRKALDQPAEPVDVAAGEGGGRLVEEQDAGLAEHRPGDLDLLPHRQLEVADLGTQVDLTETEARQMLGHAIPAFPAAELAQRPGRCPREEHVLGDGEIADERHLLKRRLHALGLGIARPCQADPLAEELDRPLVRLHEAREQLHRRRLAGTVLAQKRVHLAGAHGEGGVIEGDSGAVRLDDALDVEGGAGLGHDPPHIRAEDERLRLSPAMAGCCAYSSGRPASAACRPTSGVSGE